MFGQNKKTVKIEVTKADYAIVQWFMNEAKTKDPAMGITYLIDNFNKCNLANIQLITENQALKEELKGYKIAENAPYIQ